jgi:hypothetical protein
MVTPTGLTVEELARIFYDFKALYFTAISSVVHSQIFHAGCVRSFPYASQSMVFQLSYRMDSYGNPALAFRVESATLVPRSALDESIVGAITAGKGTTAKIKKRLQTQEHDFVDVLPVVFSFQTQTIVQQLSIRDRPSLLPHGVNGPEYFFNKLRGLSDRGHVFRDVGVGVLALGQMKKIGNKWVWIALTEEEMEAGGYTTISMAHN